MSAKPGEVTPGDAGNPPRWATAPPVDPTTGQSAIREPPVGAKDTGFAPFGIHPPRGWVNWLYENNYRWQQYFDATNQRCATQTVAASDSLADSRRQADQVCDGVADQVQIQAAIDALPATGGVVYLSEGTFAIAAGIVSRTGVTIAGAGPGVTILQVSADANYDVITFGVATTDAHVRDLGIDGNNPVRTGGNTGIDFTNCTRFSAVNVRARRMNAVAGPVGGRGFTSGTDEGLLVGCRAENNDGEGFALGSTDTVLIGCTAASNTLSGFRAADLRQKYIGCVADANTVNGFEALDAFGGGSDDFIGCTASSNGSDGFEINATHCTLEDCRGAGNTATGLFIDTMGDNTHVVGGAFGDNTGRGVLCNGDACKFIAVDIRTNGGDGIELGGLQALVEGCTIHNNAAAGIDANGGSCILHGNTIRTNGGGGIDVAGIESLVADNIVDDSTGSGITIGVAADRSVIKGNIVTASIGAVADGISLGGLVGAVVSGNVCEGNGRDGIGTSGTRHSIRGNILTGNTRYGIGTSTGCLIADNEVYNNGQHGIAVAGNDGEVQGNRVSGNGTAANNTYDNINLLTADRWSIHHNSVRDGGNPNRPRYGINVSDAASDNCQVSNNMVEAGATGTINNAGTGTDAFPLGTPLTGAGAANRTF